MIVVDQFRGFWGCWGCNRKIGVVGETGLAGEPTSSGAMNGCDFHRPIFNVHQRYCGCLMVSEGIDGVEKIFCGQFRLDVWRYLAAQP
jgi:hypothetical protein